MMAKNIVLHIGASKCGSSALQTALTETPVIQTTSGRLVYGAVDSLGKITFGSNLRPRSTRGYCASVNAPELSQIPARALSKIGRKLRRANAHTVVLSSEGWMAQGRRMTPVLAAMGVPVSAIAYVRPPVTLMNSGWWQWGCWEDVPLDRWVEDRLPISRWAENLKEWKNIPEVESVTVRLLPNDIISDFAGLFGFDAGGLPKVINRGLPGVILRLYQRNRQLRPTRRDSEIDSILSRHLTINGSPPWVLPRSLVERIIEETRESNLALLEMLDPASAQAMRNDARWWDAEAFASKNVEPWQPQPIDTEDLEKLAVDLIEAIARPYRQR